MLSGGNPLRGVGVCTFVQHLLSMGRVQRLPLAQAWSAALCSGPGPRHCHLLTPPLCLCLLWKLLITWNKCGICNLRLFNGKKAT